MVPEALRERDTVLVGIRPGPLGGGGSLDTVCGRCWLLASVQT